MPGRRHPPSRLAVGLCLGSQVANSGPAGGPEARRQAREGPCFGTFPRGVVEPPRFLSREGGQISVWERLL